MDIAQYKAISFLDRMVSLYNTGSEETIKAIHEYVYKQVQNIPALEAYNIYHDNQDLVLDRYKSIRPLIGIAMPWRYLLPQYSYTYSEWYFSSYVFKVIGYDHVSEGLELKLYMTPGMFSSWRHTLIADIDEFMNK